VTVFSPKNISGLRRPKNVKFGIKVTSSMRIMYALRFLEKSFLWQNLQKNAKDRSKMPKISTLFSSQYLRNQKYTISEKWNQQTANNISGITLTNTNI